MRHLIIALSTVLMTLPLRAGEPAVTPRPTEARPVLVGNWADPTVLRDGDDYYMTHSSFEFQPGLLIWHSKNLRSW
jgi:xylan 1,4-beta-xylosidase